MKISGHFQWPKAEVLTLKLSVPHIESEMEKMSEEKEKCFSESRRNGKNK